MFISPEKIQNAASLSAAAAFLARWPEGAELTEEVCELMAENNIPLPVNMLGPLGRDTFYSRAEKLERVYESKIHPHRYVRDNIERKIRAEIEREFTERTRQSHEDFKQNTAHIGRNHRYDLAMAFLDVARAVDAGVIDNRVLSLSSMTRRDREQMKKEALLAMIEGEKQE